MSTRLKIKEKQIIIRNINFKFSGIYETHDYESELIDEFAAKVQDERLEKSKKVLKGNNFARFLTCILLFLTGVSDR